MDELKDCESLEIIIEKRGKKEDTKLANHLNKLYQIGTYYVDVNRIKNYNINELKKIYYKICRKKLEIKEP